jgi:PadR family transcriptional regulator, regulatory protein PadR
MDSRIERSFFLGFVRVHILFHACTEEVYGRDMVAEIGRHGYELSYGTLYPILHAMERGGLLRSEKRTIRGKVRRYYECTDEGRRVLARARAAIRELVHEVLDERDTPEGNTKET